MKIYNLSEMTDSKLLYDKNPPKFMVYIVAIMLILLIIFITWSTKSIKTYVVKGTGLVTTENKSNIMAKSSGEIDEIFVNEGKEVREGEVLVSLKPVEPKLQLEQVDLQINLYNKRIELISKAEKEASKGINTFSINNSDEVEFYNKLENSYTKRKEFIVDEEDLKKQGYSEEEINKFKSNQKIKLDEAYYDTILEFTNERQQLQFEKSKLEAQKLGLEKSTEEYKILASKNGKIHLSTQLTKGMVIQSGSLMGSIATNEENLIIETLISSTDRPRIHQGDEVSLAVSGLNQSEYGTVKGIVKIIDEDATIDNTKGNVFFNIKVEPEKTYLQDKNGEKVNLSLGMVAETRIKYEKITYMNYFLEQIGVNLN